MGTPSPEEFEAAYNFYLEHYLPQRGEFRSYAGKPDTKVLHHPIRPIEPDNAAACHSSNVFIRRNSRGCNGVQGYKDGYGNFKANMERWTARDHEVRRPTSSMRTKE